MPALPVLACGFRFDGSFGFRTSMWELIRSPSAARGLRRASLPEIDLTARETRHLDVALKAVLKQTVMVVDNPLR